MKQKQQYIIMKNSNEKGKIIQNISPNKLKLESELSAHKNKFDILHDGKKSGYTPSSKKSKIVIQKQVSNAHNAKDKPVLENKVRDNNNSLFMKNDLKKLITKKTIIKQSYSHLVPDLLKNIEKNCKILKNILEKEQKVPHRRDSWQSSRQFKHSKSIVSKNKSQDLFQKVNKNEQKVRNSCNRNRNSQKKIVHKANKSISQEKSKIQSFMKEISNKKMMKVSKEQKKIAQIFKSYKKTIDFKDINPQKSKNTQYNTTQSRNSSFLLINSHGYSGLTARYEKSVNNYEQVSSLIKGQQKTAQVNIIVPEFSFKDHFQNKIASNQSEQQDRRKNEQWQTFKRTSMIQDTSVQGRQSRKEKQHFVKDEKSSQQQQRKYINKEQEINLMKSKHQNPLFSKIMPDQKQLNQLLKHQQSPQKQYTFHKQFKQLKNSKQILNNKFVCSKYYVQPVPILCLKKVSQHLNEKQNSLMGCEIPIIQNNVIDDSELESFCL